MESKKKLGIIGGMGSRAGALFLQKVINYSPAESDQEFPEIIFHNNSIIPDRTRAIIYNEASPLTDILRSVDLFNKNKIDVIALSCITSYYYYSQITGYTDAIVLNPLHLIAECLRNEHKGARRIGLLATTGTINTGLFHKELDHCFGEVVTLTADCQEDLFMRAVYMKNGFKSAKISDDARVLMDRCVQKLLEQGVDVIIGGCTEVSVAIDTDTTSIPYLDTLDLLARKTVDCCYNL